MRAFLAPQRLEGLSPPRPRALAASLTEFTHRLTRSAAFPGAGARPTEEQQP